MVGGRTAERQVHGVQDDWAGLVASWDGAGEGVVQEHEGQHLRGDGHGVARTVVGLQARSEGQHLGGQDGGHEPALAGSAERTWW